MGGGSRGSAALSTGAGGGRSGDQNFINRSGVQQKGWWTPERMTHAVDYLMKNANLTEIGAAGFGGAECRWSLPQGPASENPGSHARGIAQWLGGRKDQAAFGTFDEQLAKVAKELNEDKRGVASGAGAALRAATTALEATRGATLYERAGGFQPGMTKENAQDVLTFGTPVQSTLEAVRKERERERLEAQRLGPLAPEKPRQYFPTIAPAPTASIPRSNIHIPNVYHGGQSSEYPAPTEKAAPGPMSWLGLDKNAQRWMASNWGGDTVHHHYDNSDNSMTYHDNRKTNVTVTGATEPHEIARAVGSTLDMAFSPSQAKQRFLQGAIS